MNNNNNKLILQINDDNVLFDRVMIQENLMDGQKVRNFDILVNDKTII